MDNEKNSVPYAKPQMTIDFTNILSVEVTFRSQVVGQRNFTAAEAMIQSRKI
jgi:hypothetical protein